jgi:hypothetical protein
MMFSVINLQLSVKPGPAIRVAAARDKLGLTGMELATDHSLLITED